MSTIITGLIVLFLFSVLSAMVLFLFSLPTIVKGYRQRREDEFYLAERLTAQVKATRHRDVR